MTLDIDTPDSQSLAISGHTSYGAALTAAYTLNDGTDGTTDGIAGAYGQYLLPVTGGTLKADSVVTITASANGIAMRKQLLCRIRDNSGFPLCLCRSSCNSAVYRFPKYKPWRTRKGMNSPLL